MRTHRALWLRDPRVTEAIPWAVLRFLVRPADLVLDVGANIGVYSRFLLHATAAGELVAFEPDPKNQALWRRNVSGGRSDGRAKLVACGLGDRDGTEEFQIDDLQSTSGSISRVTGGAASELREKLGYRPKTMSIQLRRLDSLLAEEGWNPAVVKIDVEGAEGLVLRGAEKLLGARSAAFLVELHGAEQAADVSSLLLDAGYDCVGVVAYRLDPTGACRVDRLLISELRDLYDMRYVIALPLHGARVDELLDLVRSILVA